MPNHVTTRCTITGPADEVQRFRDMAILTKMEVRGDDWPASREAKERTELDFNAFIPMPEILRGSDASSLAAMGAAMILYRADLGAPFSDRLEFWSSRVREELGMTNDPVHKVARAYLLSHPDVEEMGRARLNRILATGHADWYSWSIEHWGTKWGAYSFAELSTDPLTIKFETAWSFPTPVFEKIGVAFPALTFDCVCYDEGSNFAGIGGFGATDHPFEIVAATDELYERVYGHPPDVEEDNAES